MSLIEEALRKQEHEEARHNQSPAPSAPEAPLPQVAPAPASPPPSTSPVVAATPASVVQDPPRGSGVGEDARPPSRVRTVSLRNGARAIRPDLGDMSARAAASGKEAPSVAAEVRVDSTSASVSDATSLHAYHRPPESSATTARPIHPDVGRQRNLTLGMFAGIGVLVLLVAGVAFLVMVNANRPAGAAALVPGTTKSANVPGAIASATQAPTASAPVAVASTTQSPAATLPKDRTVSLVSDVATTMTATPTGHVAAAAHVTDASARLAAVVWPEIVVKGTFSAGGKTLVLLGDGLTLDAGATTPGGVRMLEAGAGWVRVAYKGQTRTYHRSGGAFTADTEEVSADSTQP